MEGEGLAWEERSIEVVGAGSRIAVTTVGLEMGRAVGGWVTSVGLVRGRAVVVTAGGGW